MIGMTKKKKVRALGFEPRSAGIFYSTPKGDDVLPRRDLQVIAPVILH